MGGLVGPLELRDVPGKAARVDETAVVPKHARGDRHVPNRAVLAAQLRLVVVQDLAIRQACQNVGRGLRVDVELGDVAPDVFVLAIAQHLELATVGPQDRAIRARPVQRYGGVLEEVGKLLLGSATRILRAHALQAERELAGDGDGHIDLALGEGVAAHRSMS